MANGADDRSADGPDEVPAGDTTPGLDADGEADGGTGPDAVAQPNVDAGQQKMVSATVDTVKRWQRQFFSSIADITLFTGMVAALLVIVGAVHAGLLWAHQSGAGWFGLLAIGVVAGLAGLVVAAALFLVVAATLPDDSAEGDDQAGSRRFDVRWGPLSTHSLAVFFGAGFAWWLLSNLQGGMRTVVSLLRLPETVGYTFADLNHRPEAAVATWLQAPSAAPGNGLSSAIGLFTWHAVIDLAMIAAATLALLALLSRINNLLEGQEIGGLVFNAVAGIGLLALIEVIELLVRSIFLSGEWVAQCEGASAEFVGCTGAPPPTWMWNGWGEGLWGVVATVIGVARPVSLLLFVALPIVFGLGSLLRDPVEGKPVPPLGALLRPVRIQLAAIVVFALTAIFPLQAPDVFLRLGDNMFAYIAALIASAILGTVLFASTVAGYGAQRDSAPDTSGSSARPLPERFADKTGPIPRSTLVAIGGLMVAAGAASAFSGRLAIVGWVVAAGTITILYARSPRPDGRRGQVRPPIADRLGRAATPVVALGALLAAAGFSQTPFAGWGWAVGGGLLVLTAAVSALLDSDESDEYDETSRRKQPLPDAAFEARVVRWMAPGLACLPAAICGLALLKWSVPEAIFITELNSIDRLVAQGVGFLVLGAAIFVAARLVLRPGQPGLPATERQHAVKRYEKIIWFGVATVGAVVALVIVLEPVTRAPALGALSVLMLFLSALVGLVTFLLRTTDRRQAPYAAYLLGFNHPPVLFALLLWAGIASVIAAAAGVNDAHQVRESVEAQTFAFDIAVECGSVAAPNTPEGLFDRWLARNGLPAVDSDAEPAPGGERPAVPVVMVAGSGGGIRAAYWTAATMEEIFGHDALTTGEPCPDAASDEISPDRLLFASGISGSSLGLASWAAVVADGRDQVDQNWPAEALGDDYISAQLAWGLLVEVPRLWLRFDMGADRAEILERSWEQSWDGDWAGDARLTSGHLSAADRPIEPQLVLGGAVVQDGCWLIVSALRVSPSPAAARCYAEEGDGEGGVAGSYSVTAFMCPGGDLRRSTAALLSARFPLISPSGTLERCGDDLDPTRPEQDEEPEPVQGPERIQVIDGGYIDASAADLLGRTWRVMEPLIDDYNRQQEAVCLVPVVIQLDNGFIAPSPPASPQVFGQPAAVFNGVLSARESIGQRARHEAVLDFDRYVRIVPRAQPGVSPSLGWALSEETIARMDEEIGGHGNSVHNPATRASIDEARQLITEPGTATC